MAYQIYSPEDGETDVTPRDITDLSLEEQVEFITLWFHALFEDPQNQTPYAADKDSPYNYEYIWGGPYYAGDEIGDHFAGLASDDAIEAAVREVENNGIIEWAPGAQHPDRRAIEDEAAAEETDAAPPSLDEIRRRLEVGAVPRFGDPLEAEAREALRSEITQLRELLAQHAPQHGGIGHNNPPDETALLRELTVNITVTIDQIDVELAKPDPDADTVVESASKLETVLAWVFRKLDKAVDGVMNRIGVLAVAGELAGLPIFESIGRVFNAALEWLDTVTLPF